MAAALTLVASTAMAQNNCRYMTEQAYLRLAPVVLMDARF
jgi:hypothetical protein